MLQGVRTLPSGLPTLLRFFSLGYKPHGAIPMYNGCHVPNFYWMNECTPGCFLYSANLLPFPVTSLMFTVPLMRYRSRWTLRTWRVFWIGALCNAVCSLLRCPKISCTNSIHTESFSLDRSPSTFFNAWSETCDPCPSFSMLLEVTVASVSACLGVGFAQVISGPFLLIWWCGKLLKGAERIFIYSSSGHLWLLGFIWITCDSCSPWTYSRITSCF